MNREKRQQKTNIKANAIPALIGFALLLAIAIYSIGKVPVNMTIMFILFAIIPIIVIVYNIIRVRKGK